MGVDANRRTNRMTVDDYQVTPATNEVWFVGHDAAGRDTVLIEAGVTVGVFDTGRYYIEPPQFWADKRPNGQYKELYLNPYQLNSILNVTMYKWPSAVPPRL
jgi:hypothetical protein